MKHTEELEREIKQELNALNKTQAWGFDDYFRTVDKVIVTREQDHVMKVIIHTSISPLIVNVDTFRVLSTVLGTQAIDIVGHELVRSGCITCDHGTEFTNEFVAYDAKV